jgi:LmbE family N-acetylglucosaminyl deacetylase
MLTFAFPARNHAPLRVLCLGAHCDDIEIGCGGTILRLSEAYANTEFFWVAFSSNVERACEAYESANIFLQDIQSKHIEIKEFRDGFFPFIGSEIKQEFEGLKQRFSPDLIFTHYRHDSHQDHRLISDLTWNTFRNHLILEYEIPKYDGDISSPNFYVQLDESICRRKICYILNAFKSQEKKDWFDEETFSAMLRIRGMESRSPSKYAEAFYCHKMTL